MSLKICLYRLRESLPFEIPVTVDLIHIEGARVARKENLFQISFPLLINHLINFFLNSQGGRIVQIISTSLRHKIKEKTFVENKTICGTIQIVFLLPCLNLEKTKLRSQISSL